MQQSRSAGCCCIGGPWAGAFAFSNSINALTIGGTEADVVITGSRSYSGDLACSDSTGNHVSFRSSGDTKRASTQHRDYPLSFDWSASSHVCVCVCVTVCMRMCVLFFSPVLFSPYLLFLPRFFFPFFFCWRQRRSCAISLDSGDDFARAIERAGSSPLLDIALHSARDLR